MPDVVIDDMFCARNVFCQVITVAGRDERVSVAMYDQRRSINMLQLLCHVMPHGGLQLAHIGGAMYRSIAGNRGEIVHFLRVVFSEAWASDGGIVLSRQFSRLNMLARAGGQPRRHFLTGLHMRRAT